MLRKPEACKLCPYYGRSDYWVPDEVVEGATVWVHFQNPHIEEEKQGRPTVGKTGQVMETAFFPIAGVQRGQVSIGNALRCRIGEGTELPPLRDREMRDALVHCTRAHFKPPAAARVFVAAGEYALYSLTGEGMYEGHKIGDWRGWVLPFSPLDRSLEYQRTIWTPAVRDRVVLATYHLAYLFRNPRAKVALQRDWAKIPLIVKGTWPEPIPPIATERTEPIAGLWAFDTEYDDKGLTCFSMARRFVDKTQVYVLGASERVLIAEPPTFVMHNCWADLGHLETVTRLARGGYKVEDTMLAHAVLWGGLEHTLDYCGSIYSRINRWKHLQYVNNLLYSAGDAIGTWDVWAALAKEFTRDDRSEWVYRNLSLPLVPIIRKAEARGARLDQDFLPVALADLDLCRLRATLNAQAAVGYPIALGSQQQVAFQLYVVEQINRKRKVTRSAS